MMNTAINTEIVEVQLTAGKLKYNLGDPETLRRKKVTGLIITPSGYLSEEGRTIQDPANAYLYLKDDNNRIRHELPARLLIATPGTPLLHVFPFEMVNIDWEKSELIFAPGTTIAANSSLELTILWEEK